MPGANIFSHTRTDTFFVTMEKDAKDRAASIMYKDYAMSPDVFHWESQNNATPISLVGQRYLDHKAAGRQILLFTRARENDEAGLTMPYVWLAQLDYTNHTESKPIAITWKLQRPMPADVYTEASTVARSAGTQLVELLDGANGPLTARIG